MANNNPAAQNAPQKLSRKERKRQKKELRARQIALEKQLIAEGKIRPRAKYKANSFFWRVFALCLSFFFGIFATVGGIAAFGVLAPVKDVVGLAGFDITKVLNEEYASQSILDLVKTITSDSFDSLGAVSKYTPVLDDYLQTFQNTLAESGVHLNLDEVKATKFEDLGPYFQDTVLGTIVLGEVLGLEPGDDGLVIGICYGDKGTDYVVQDGKIVPVTPPLTIGDLTGEDGAQNLIKKITIEQALGVDASSNAAMRFLAYGTEGTEYRITDGKIVMLENELTGEKFPKKTLDDLISAGTTPIENAKVSDLVTVESETGILAAIKDWRISDLQDTYRIERLRIGQVMDIDGQSSKIAQAIQNWRLGDLTDAAKMNTLTLGEVIDVDESSPLILRSLADTPIGEFGDAVDGLRLSDILEEKDFEGNNFLKTLRTSSLTTLADDLKKLSAADVFGEEMYSYLDPAENGDKHYLTLYEDYQTGHADAEKSGIVPTAHVLAEGESVRSYFEPTAGGARLTGGYYTGEAGNYAAVDTKDVHARREGDAVTYYVKGEQRLEERREWKFVDYDNEQLAPLPAGDAISAETEGYRVLPREGTPYTENGAPMYYLTTQAVFENGKPVAGGGEQVAYPLLQDGYGIYYTYLLYTPGEDGPDEFRAVRADLEYALSSLSYEKDGGRVTLTQNADGDWTDGESAVAVYEKPAAQDTPAYFYIKTEAEVHYGYYAEGAVERVYAADEVTEKFEIVHADGNAVSVDRYLSGVWFYLFGIDEEGALTDRSDLPVLELTDVMTGMTDSLSNTELWQMYFNGLLTSNPFVDLTKIAAGGIPIGKKSVKNLNECTVVECISLVRYLVQMGVPLG